MSVSCVSFFFFILSLARVTAIFFLTTSSFFDWTRKWSDHHRQWKIQATRESRLLFLVFSSLFLSFVFYNVFCFWKDCSNTAISISITFYLNSITYSFYVDRIGCWCQWKTMSANEREKSATNKKKIYNKCEENEIGGSCKMTRYYLLNGK